MTQFDDRERAFESKFAHDDEMRFRITARRNRLLGEWAARKMGLSGDETESYAKDMVRSDFDEAGGNLLASGFSSAEADSAVMANAEATARLRAL